MFHPNSATIRPFILLRSGVRSRGVSVVSNLLRLFALLSWASFGVLTSAQDSSRNARDLFYDPAEPATSYFGIRYALLRRTRDGVYTEVRPDTIFRANDEVRLKINSNREGYLYIVQQGSTGGWSLLFPNPEIYGGKNVITASVDYQIPGPADSFIVDDHPGEERLFVLLSRAPIERLDRLTRQSGVGQSSVAKPVGQDNPGAAVPDKTVRIDDALVRHLREQSQSRDLVLTPESGGKDNGTYVVDEVISPHPQDDRIALDIKLDHR